MKEVSETAVMSISEPVYEDVKSRSDRLIYPFSCNRQANQGQPMMVDAHWHYDIEMLYALSGEARLFLNGRFYSFAAGDMVLISAREVHAVWGSEDTEYICIKFDPEILYTSSRSIFESRYVLPFTMSKVELQKIFSEHEIKHTPLPALIHSALQEFTDKTYGFELAVRTHICQIFLWVLRNWQGKGLEIDTSYALNDSDRERLQVVFDQIDQKYMQNLTAKEMARICNMSYSYFSRFFKSAIGKSFTAYLNHVRLTEAEKLLVTTSKTITEISMETGFSSTSYFISQFRRHKNVSPRQFRQKLTERLSVSSQL